MQIEKIYDSEKLTLKVTGRLDSTNFQDLEKEANASIDSIKELEFDFTDLEYLSSAGLRVLLSAQKKMNSKGKMTVSHANNAVKDIFRITGFSEILTIID